MTTTPPDKFDVLRNVVEQLKGLSPEEQDRIIRWTCEELGISVPVKVAAPGSAGMNPPPVGAPANPSPNGSTDIKTFVDEKKPQSDIQFSVVVTYYYRFIAPDKKESITPEDLQEAARLSGRARLAKPSKTLGNAVTTGLLDSAGHGQYKINTVGENLVAIVLPGEGKINGTVKRKNNASKKKTIGKRK